MEPKPRWWFLALAAASGCANGGSDTHDRVDAGDDARSDTTALFEVESDDGTDAKSPILDAADLGDVGAEAPPCSGTLCAGVCTDLSKDQDNCGKCGKICPSGMSCISGTCECVAPRTLCPSGCVNTAKDANNCGGCGYKCVAPKTCVGGSCG